MLTGSKACGGYEARQRAPEQMSCSTTLTIGCQRMRIQSIYKDALQCPQRTRLETRLQFHRAIGTASVASQIVSVQTSPREFTVNIQSVEADWDDENQRVKVRVEIGLISNGATVAITQIRYWVAILAQM
jgi:hypothetical protein